jgi:hypothetical protein
MGGRGAAGARAGRGEGHGGARAPGRSTKKKKNAGCARAAPVPFARRPLCLRTFICPPPCLSPSPPAPCAPLQALHTTMDKAATNGDGLPSKMVASYSGLSSCSDGGRTLGQHLASRLVELGIDRGKRPGASGRAGGEKGRSGACARWGLGQATACVCGFGDLGDGAGVGAGPPEIGEGWGGGVRVAPHPPPALRPPALPSSVHASPTRSLCPSPSQSLPSRATTTWSSWTS